MIEYLRKTNGNFNTITYQNPRFHLSDLNEQIFVIIIVIGGWIYRLSQKGRNGYTFLDFMDNLEQIKEYIWLISVF